MFFLAFLSACALACAEEPKRFLTAEFFERLSAAEAKIKTAAALEVERVLEWAAEAMAAIKIGAKVPALENCRLTCGNYEQLQYEFCTKGFQLCWADKLSLRREEKFSQEFCDGEKGKTWVDYGYECGRVYDWSIEDFVS